MVQLLGGTVVLYKLALTFDPVTSKIKHYKHYFSDVLFVLIFLLFLT